MTRKNAFGADLSDNVARENLPRRVPPYFQVVEWGRAIGYENHGPNQYFWLGRVRRKNGRYRQHRLGRVKSKDGKIGLTFDEALLRAREWFAKLENRVDLVDAVRVTNTIELSFCPIGKDFTIGHALHDYVEWKRLSMTRSNLVVLVNHINFHLVPRLINIATDQFHGEYVRAFVRDVLETPTAYRKPLKPKRPISTMTEEQLRLRKKTVNKLLSILRGAVLMAWENGKTDSERGWRCIRRLPVVERPRMLHLNRTECHQLLDECDPALRQLVLAALYTGCRASELMRMKVGDFRRDGTSVYVSPAKSYQERYVFLPDEGLELFRELTNGKQSSEPIFLTLRGKEWCKHNYKHYFRKAVLASSLPRGLCFHSLRHTYASQLIADGAPYMVISDQLGHKNCVSVMRTYGHLAPQGRQFEVRSRFASLIAVSPPNLN